MGWAFFFFFFTYTVIVNMQGDTPQLIISPTLVSPVGFYLEIMSFSNSWTFPFSLGKVDLFAHWTHVWDLERYGTHAAKGQNRCTQYCYVLELLISYNQNCDPRKDAPRRPLTFNHWYCSWWLTPSPWNHVLQKFCQSWKLDRAIKQINQFWK